MSNFAPTLIHNIADAMDDINDLGVKHEDFAEEAFRVLEISGFRLKAEDQEYRQDFAWEAGFAISERQEREARRGNYDAKWELYAEAVLEWLVQQGYTIPTVITPRKLYNVIPRFVGRDDTVFDVLCDRHVLYVARSRSEAYDYVGAQRSADHDWVGTW